MRDIGKELGVAYLIEGSVQKGGNRLRITVQFVETETGAHVWSSRYDGTVDDIFDLQDRITEQLAGAIQPSIRIAEIERSRRKRPQDLGAYDYTMRAMPHVWALEKEEAAKALDLLEKALAIDPDYPLALSLAGWCHAQRSVYNWVDDIAEAQAKARSLAERAAELSGDDPIILAVLGAIHTFVRNFGTARILLERALALDPNAAWAWHPARLGRELFRPAAGCDRPFRARASPEPARSDEFQQLCRPGLGAPVHGAIRTGRDVLPARRWRSGPTPSGSIAILQLAAGRGPRGGGQSVCRMMRAYPDLTVTKFKQAMVFSPAALERMAKYLRQLGLPE